MELNMENILMSTFRKTGIFPLNKKQVFSKLPKASLNNSLGDMADFTAESLFHELEEGKVRQSQDKRKYIRSHKFQVGGV